MHDKAPASFFFHLSSCIFPPSSLIWLFGVTLFLSAGLLFCVQPMVAKMILPLLGGSPAVWNTCMVFFQFALLAGYLYAHATSHWLPPRGQIISHGLVLLLPFLVLPVVVSEGHGLPSVGPPPETYPVWWLLQLLALVVGLPFLVVSTSAPLLQKWFAQTGHAAAGDPYFLYAASNCGSMAALLGYPLVIEPLLGLSEQGTWWLCGYAALVLLTLACAARAWRSPHGASEGPATPTDPPLTTPPPPTLGRRLYWIILAFVPSALLLAVTTYITTDVAAIPLLWVMPLAVYLLSFILVFARRQIIPLEWMLTALPVVALVVVFAFLNNVALRFWQLIPLHWLVLLVAALALHGQLARDRPPARYLTEFYLWLSVGGMLGGMFTALLAPLLFQSGILEYPLLLIVACLLRPGPGLRNFASLARWLDLLVPLGVAAVVLVMGLAVRAHYPDTPATVFAAVVGVPTFICFLCKDRPARFALAVAAMFLTVSAVNVGGLHTLVTERNFFGVVRVYDDPDTLTRVLMHGSTQHGMQRIDELGQPDPNAEPLSYFSRQGPIGQVFAVFNGRLGTEVALPPRVGITGLGVGALASYARPGQAWTYYEIDPAVCRVAEDRRLFSYLDQARQREAPVRVVLGDARYQMQRTTDPPYGLIVLDAFSSDSVPAHLLTEQALQLYLEHLAPRGLLVFNISNRYLDLRPVLAGLARKAGLAAYVWFHEVSEAEEKETGRRPSQWVVIARDSQDLGDLSRAPWTSLEELGAARPWTDDFSNIWSALRWR